MSSKCLITIRNVEWLKREVMLYQHTDGHPNSMFLSLAEELRSIHAEFNDHGDVGWFMDPCKLASVLIVRSIPELTDEMKRLMNTLSPASKNRLESNLFLGMPLLVPEVKRIHDCNYEYVITLRESLEEKFFGYTLEVYRLQNSKRAATILTNEENFSARSSILPKESLDTEYSPRD